MKEELVFRRLTEEDYKIICDWWKWWWNTVVCKDFLPEYGVGGYMIEKNNTPIACGFTYETNSKVAFLGWVVSNPKYKKKDRRSIIKLLIKKIEETCKKLGYKHLFTVCSNKHLINIHKSLNWHNNKKESYELFKKL